MKNLRTFRDWCRASSGDETLPDHERTVWADLADRIDTYLEEHQ